MTKELYFITDTGMDSVGRAEEMRVQMLADPQAVFALKSKHEERMAAINAFIASAKADTPDEEFADVFGDTSRIITHGNARIGVINVNGAIETSESWWHSYMGVMSYERMGNILTAFEQMGNINEVLFVWNSPGGKVKGAFDMASRLQTMQRDGMAMTSYAETMMASAAILLGTVPKDVYTSSDADIGSVGAMATLVNYRKALDKAGIEYTTFKYGKLKDMGSPYRDMTKEEASIFQSRIDRAGVQIVTAVQQNRGMTAEQFKLAAGDAKVVFGTDAVASGLADGIKTLDEVVNMLIERHNAPKSSMATPNGAQKMTLKLNAQGIAAVAAGMSVDEAMKQAALTEEVMEAPVETPDEAPADEPVAAAPEADEPAPVAEPAAQAGLMELVTQLTDAKVQAKTAEDKLSAALTENTNLKTDLDALVKIAAVAVTNLEVACGNVNASLATFQGMSPTELTSRFESLSATFKSKMRTGPVSAAPAKKEGQSASAAGALKSRMDAVIGN